MVKPGYKQTGIGVLPEDWECVELNRLSDGGMQNGVFYEVNRKGTGVGIINVSDLYKKSPIEFDVLEKFNATDTEIQRFKVKSGDLFFTRSSVVPSGIAYCNWYNENESSIALFDSHVVRFKTDTCSVVPMYLYLQCVSQKSRKYFISVAKTAIMTTIDQSLIGKCLIPLPPKPEQEAIAAALSDMDALIDNLEKLIAKKKAIKQGAMQELLTGKRRLPGFTGEWKEWTIEECSDFFDNQRIPVAAALRTKGNTPYYGANGILDYVEGYTHDGEYVLIAEDGANSLIDYPVLYSKGKIWVNNHAHVISGKRGIAFSDYIAYALKMVDFQGVLVGGTRAKLNSKTLKYIKLLLPELDEQRKIVIVLRDMDSEIEKLEKNLSKYKNIKSGMMSELLTGRIRLV